MKAQPRKIEITVERRFLWRLWRKRIRRVLPASWSEVAPARRLPLLRLLYQYPGAAGRVRALRALIDLPKPLFLALDDDQVGVLLDATAWLEAMPSPDVSLAWFDHERVRYYAPLSHGLNLVGLEYPIADEAFNNFVKTGDMEHLHLLCGALYREANPAEDDVIRRGDIRVPLRSRWEAEARAKRLATVSNDVTIAVFLYFAGVKQFVYQSYGGALFESPELDDAGNPVPVETAPNLGWWTLYFSLATDGPFGRNVEEVYQTAFHDICLYLVDRKRQEERREMQRRMNTPDFGIPQT